MSGAPSSLAGQLIVPVVVIDDPHRARDLVEGLLAGGIGCAEFALRTPRAIDALAAAADVPGFIVGVGTVVTPEQLHRAADAGARFGVAPGLDLEVAATAESRGVDFVPGVATPTDVSRALRAGIDHLKLYPAVPLGGLPYLGALVGPFPDVRFLPSGGLGAVSAPEWVAHPAVFAVSGSWMVPRDAIAAGDGDRIAHLARAAVESLANASRPEGSRR